MEKTYFLLSEIENWNFSIFLNPYLFLIQYSRPLFFHKIQYWAEKTLLNHTLINWIACMVQSNTDLWVARAPEFGVPQGFRRISWWVRRPGPKLWSKPPPLCKRWQPSAMTCPRTSRKTITRVSGSSLERISPDLQSLFIHLICDARRISNISALNLILFFGWNRQDNLPCWAWICWLNYTIG